MEILYNIGSLDIFRNLRYILLFIVIISIIGCVLKIRKISDNYNSINKPVTMLDIIKRMSDFEFRQWVEEYLFEEGYVILQLSGNIGKIKDIETSEEKLIYINRKYSLLDKEEARIIDGLSILEDNKNIFVITLGKTDKTFKRFLEHKNIELTEVSKNNFNVRYEEFIGKKAIF